MGIPFEFAERCLFCKRDATASRSVEHVIPESLGNSSMVLPPGVICDACNNYFSREVEKPFLESEAVAALRFDQRLVSKKGRIPPRGAILTTGHPVIVQLTPKGPDLGLMQTDDPDIMTKLQRASHIEVQFQPPQAPSPEVVSRFLAKVALEVMAVRIYKYPGGLHYLVDEAQLDPIRRYAREGRGAPWPHHARRIYDADAHWHEPGSGPLQRVWECDFLVTEGGEWYFVLGLFGLELALNMAGPSVEGYQHWLKQHPGRSPLHFGKNEEQLGPLLRGKAVEEPPATPA